MTSESNQREEKESTSNERVVTPRVILEGLGAIGMAGLIFKLAWERRQADVHANEQLQPPEAS